WSSEPPPSPVDPHPGHAWPPGATLGEVGFPKSPRRRQRDGDGKASASSADSAPVGPFTGRGGVTNMGAGALPFGFESVKPLQLAVPVDHRGGGQKHQQTGDDRGADEDRNPPQAGLSHD